MAGICGIVTWKQDPEPFTAILTKCFKALTHRGPSPKFLRQGPALLGVTDHRLNEQTHQICLQSDSALLAFDGRLDNREELILTLGLHNNRPNDLSNPTLVLAAYRRWGQDCPTHLLGDFACVLWDQNQQQLFCFRDVFGIRPLFFYHDDQRLVFASEIKALLCFPWVPKRLCQEQLAHYFRWSTKGYHDQLTFYQDIFRVPAAASLSLTCNGLLIQNYWKPDPQRELCLASDQDYVEAFYALFRKVILRRLPQSGHTGVALSGGFDSSSITAMAASILAQQGKSIYAYTSAPPESRQAPHLSVRRYADSLHRKWPNLEMVYQEKLPPLLPDQTQFEICQEPTDIQVSYLHSLIKQAHSQGIGTLFFGYGGDQAATLRNPGYLAGLLVAGKIGKLWHALGERSAATGQSKRNVFKNHVVKLLLPHWAWVLFYQLKQPDSFWQTHAAPSLAVAHYAGLLPAEQRVPLEAFRHLPTLRANGARGLQIAMNTPLFGNINRLTAYYQMEACLPMLDREIVELGLALPAEQHVAHGRQRHMIRRAMKDHLPEEILERTETNDFIANDLKDRFNESIELFRSELEHLNPDPTNAKGLPAKLASYLAPSQKGSQAAALTFGISGAKFAKWLEDSP